MVLFTISIVHFMLDSIMVYICVVYILVMSLRLRYTEFLQGYVVIQFLVLEWMFALDQLQGYMDFYRVMV